jgi:hypothetical protein
VELSLLAAPLEQAICPEEEDIPVETVAVIAAAFAVFLGTRFRIRSLELMHPDHSLAGRWMRQGRTFVQASHNLRTNR